MKQYTHLREAAHLFLRAGMPFPVGLVEGDWRLVNDEAAETADFWGATKRMNADGYTICRWALETI
jgi:hypothetical protein